MASFDAGAPAIRTRGLQMRYGDNHVLRGITNQIKKGEEDVQKLTDHYIKLIDKTVEDKEKEIMKEQIITNRERAIKVLKNRAAAKGKANQQGKPASAPVFSRPIMNRSGMNNKADKTRKALSIRDRAHEIQQRTGMGYFEALSQAQRELGEA